MGVITDAVAADVFNPMEKALADVDEMLWTDIYFLAEYVDMFWYQYWEQLYGSGMNEGEIRIAVTIALTQDMIDVCFEYIMRPIREELNRTLHLQGKFWNFITSELGISYNSQNSSYAWIAGGWKERIDDKIKELEANVSPFTDEQIAKLEYVADHYEEIKSLVEDDIAFILQQVLDEITPQIDTLVAKKIAPFNDRLVAVETAVAKTQFWFWEFLIDMWAWLIGNQTIPIDQLENAMITIGEWFIDEIFKITDPMKEQITELYTLVGTGGGLTEAEINQLIKDALNDFEFEGGLTEEEVLVIVQTEIAGIEAIKGEKGDPGVPGERGAKGEPGEKGEPGAPGEISIHEVNEALYSELWYAGAITTNTVTGVIDWMLYTYGERFSDLQGQITPITEFFTDEMKTDLAGLVDKFGSPEAIVNFLIPDSEGQEKEVLDLMQVLISLTFERGM